jgi:hypothetical protein
MRYTRAGAPEGQAARQQLDAAQVKLRAKVAGYIRQVHGYMCRIFSVHSRTD